MAARTRSLRKRQEIPSGHDASQYVTRRLHAPAADGDYVYLDRCNGVQTADGYTYVGTPTFPYVNSCYKGAPSENALDDTYIRLNVGMGPGMGPP